MCLIHQDMHVSLSSLVFPKLSCRHHTGLSRLQACFITWSKSDTGMSTLHIIQMLSNIFYGAYYWCCSHLGPSEKTQLCAELSGLFCFSHTQKNPLSVFDDTDIFLNKRLFRMLLL